MFERCAHVARHALMRHALMRHAQMRHAGTRAAVVWLFGLVVLAAPLSAQDPTLTVTQTSAAVDTTVTAADLNAGSATFSLALTVAITTCRNGSGTHCRAYMSANLKEGTSVSNIRWSLVPGCASGTTAVASGSTPPNSPSSAALLAVQESKDGNSGTATVYICYSRSSLGWTTAPSSTAYELFFTLIRQ